MDEQEKVKKKAKKENGLKKIRAFLSSPIKRNIVIAIAALVVTTIVIVLSLPDTNVDEKHESFDVQAICELATLKCRYHNVAFMSARTGFLNLGHKEVWLEFDGYITIGIDVDEVYISDPSEDGIVQVYLPPSKILSSTIDKSTIQKPVSDTSLFVDITAEEELDIVEKAQAETENDAHTNTKIFGEADRNAKVIVEQYIVNIGKMTGKSYTVEWLDSAPHTATES